MHDIADPPEARDGFCAASLTEADVSALDAFLKARCEEVYGRYRKDAPEARMVRAFCEATE